MRGCLHLHSDNAPSSRIETHGILILLVAVHILASCIALRSSRRLNYVLDFARRDRSICESKSHQKHQLTSKELVTMQIPLPSTKAMNLRASVRCCNQAHWEFEFVDVRNQQHEAIEAACEKLSKASGHR
jgi:hypothetical protein